MTTILTIETPSLGDRSYVAVSGDTAVVVDPQRDVDRVLAVLSARGLRLSHVLETHVHNDYVSGGLDLARRTGAAYVLPEGSGAQYPHLVARDGDVLEAGDLRVTAVHTPGHTHHHTSYAVTDPDGEVVVFTGGSMLFGSTGRTDLVGPEFTDELTHLQYHSVRRLAALLPDDAEVLPTHGFGSFCSATQTEGTQSTVAQQRAVNPALTQDEEEFVRTLLAGLDAFPAYYAHMGPLNRQGPDPVDLSEPVRVDAEELRRRLAAGEWVVDLRARTAFAAGHLRGSLGFELGDSFLTYLGWLLPWGAELTLLGETPEQVAAARRDLARIGVDRLAGAAVGPVEELAAGAPLADYRRTDFAGLKERLAQAEPVQLLDVRRHDERREGHIPGAAHVPIHELLQRVDEVPEGEVWVHCAAGYRASVAASVLTRAGRTVVAVDDDYAQARALGLEAQPAQR